jgi:hypothetical protein
MALTSVSHHCGPTEEIQAPSWETDSCEGRARHPNWLSFARRTFLHVAATCPFLYWCTSSNLYVYQISSFLLRQQSWWAQQVWGRDLCRRGNRAHQAWRTYRPLTDFFPIHLGSTLGEGCRELRRESLPFVRDGEANNGFECTLGLDLFCLVTLENGTMYQVWSMWWLSSEVYRTIVRGRST